MYIVAYPGGCYGQFIAWALEWMQGSYPTDYRPFTKQNNSHNWKNENWRSCVDEAVSNPRENHKCILS